ncbi:hypothetical protein HDU97_008664, partial [Phlyctochytrium planicorne]
MPPKKTAKTTKKTTPGKDQEDNEDADEDEIDGELGHDLLEEIEAQDDGNPALMALRTLISANRLDNSPGNVKDVLGRNILCTGEWKSPVSVDQLFSALSVLYEARCKE